MRPNGSRHCGYDVRLNPRTEIVVILYNRYLRGGGLDRMRGARVLACVLAPLVACTPGITVVGGTVSGPSPRTDTTPVVVSTPQSRITWPVRVREHVDLWLHGFAPCRRIRP